MTVEMAVKSDPDRLPFYNFNKLWSRNAWYNLVIGSRGTGKTYGSKKHGIRNALKRGEEFIYLRRYKPEKQAARDTFFADIAPEFPEWDFKIQGDRGYAVRASTRDEKRRPWQLICYFMELSRAGNQKSVAFPKVTLIIYDEFIIDKGHQTYLPNEVKKFLEFYNTVDRYQTKTKVLMLSNSVSIMNPYFLEWDIDVKPNQEWLLLYDGFICVHFHDSESFQSEVFKTPFGQFIQKTDYANYAVGNAFRDNDAELIERKTEDASYKFTLETKSGTFSVWVARKHSLWYMQEKRPGNEAVFTLIPENMSEEKTLLFKNDKLLHQVKSAFRHGKLLFDTPTTRNAFRELF